MKELMQSVTEALSLAGAVARSSQLRNIALIAADFDSEARDVEPAPQPQVHAKWERPDASTMTVRISFRLHAWRGEDSERRGVNFHGTYELGYEVDSDEDISNEQFECFARVNGLYHSWPYWREFVQSCSVRAGLPPLTLGVISAIEAASLAGFSAASPEEDEEPA